MYDFSINTTPQCDEAPKKKQDEEKKAPKENYAGNSIEQCVEKLTENINGFHCCIFPPFFLFFWHGRHFFGIAPVYPIIVWCSHLKQVSWKFTWSSHVSWNTEKDSTFNCILSRHNKWYKEEKKRFLGIIVVLWKHFS